jgi:hypothetical protein
VEEGDGGCCQEVQETNSWSKRLLDRKKKILVADFGYVSVGVIASSK